MASAIMKLIYHMELIYQDLTAIPSLCIDIVQDVGFSMRSINDIHQALMLDIQIP